MRTIIEIQELTAKELDPYTRNTESQLLHYYEPDLGIFIAESPNVITRALDAGYAPLSFLCGCGAADKALLARCPNVPLYVANSDVFAKISGITHARGMLCAMRRQPLPEVHTLCQAASRIAVLENIVNPTNIGAIFRSAAALDIDAVLLSPTCCDPLYRRAARVSMGTVFQIPWCYVPRKAKEIRPNHINVLLHQNGFFTVAMALRDDTLALTDPSLKSHAKLAIFLGSEGNGLSPETIAGCDATVRIPMAHGVDSLNVAAASAVAFWELGRHPAVP